MMRSFSKIALGLATIIFSNIVCAQMVKDQVISQPVVQTLKLNDGFYVGAQAGYDSYSVKLVTPAMPTIPNGNPILAVAPIFKNQHASIAATGWAGGLLVGFGKYWHSIYLGAEAFMNAVSANQQYVFANNNPKDSILFFDQPVPPTNAQGDDLSFKVTSNWGVAFLPGYKITDTSLLYIRLGYSTSHIKMQESGSTNLAVYNSTWTGWKGGFNYGVGLEAALRPKLSIRGEYTRTNMPKRTMLFTTFSPDQNQFMLSLIYHI